MKVQIKDKENNSAFFGDLPLGQAFKLESRTGLGEYFYIKTDTRSALVHYHGVWDTVNMVIKEEVWPIDSTLIIEKGE